MESGREFCTPGSCCQRKVISPRTWQLYTTNTPSCQPTNHVDSDERVTLPQDYKRPPPCTQNLFYSPHTEAPKHPKSQYHHSRYPNHGKITEKITEHQPTSRIHSAKDVSTDLVDICLGLQLHAESIYDDGTDPRLSWKLRYFEGNRPSATSAGSVRCACASDMNECLTDRNWGLGMMCDRLL